MNKKYNKMYSICIMLAILSIVFSENRILPLLFGVSLIIVSIVNLIFLKKEEAHYILNICVRILLIAAGIYIIIDSECFLA